ncbi:hypothetical protein AKJ51_01625 [candidate division MSBL1 archaeon SCGC-AAA382A20]|uniref:Uncharacterized protein n=1 Tax=candidate division MSBL1 archaeon SCGC-AAA382A20 TaxID=1698280 RepID=A0A133VLG0_9EURY|nr:hypothetical protein AKJ51_01625 [candidate division MSBL1 archaeon SCGC-AAA382A20]
MKHSTEFRFYPPLFFYRESIPRVSKTTPFLSRSHKSEISLYPPETMNKLKAKCKECGKSGEVITMLVGGEEPDVENNFTCYGCWRKKAGSNRVRAGAGDPPIGWLKK